MVTHVPIFAAPCKSRNAESPALLNNVTSCSIHNLTDNDKHTTTNIHVTSKNCSDKCPICDRYRIECYQSLVQRGFWTSYTFNQ